MLIAMGIDVDPTFSAFVTYAVETGVAIRAVNLRALAVGRWRFPIPPQRPAELSFCGEEVSLEPADSYFCRLIDFSDRTEAQEVRDWSLLMAALGAWLEAVPGRVVNRPFAGLSNSSKPLHELLLKEQGFRVPESITSSDRAVLKCFATRNRCISKTVSGVRAETTIVNPSDFANFVPSMGPVHLQQYVPGDDARIHVIGSRVVALRAPAGAVDYRSDNGIASMGVFDPPSQLCEMLIRATKKLGLAFAGWDFKIDSSECYWCLEANPMPGYSPYDARCDNEISRALMSYLV